MFTNEDLRLAELAIGYRLSGKYELVGNIVRTQPWYRKQAHELAKSYYQARIELERRYATRNFRLNPKHGMGVNSTHSFLSIQSHFYT